MAHPLFNFDVALAALVIMLGLPIGSMAQEADATPQNLDQQLTFDFPEMHVGVAEYDEGPTGTTVFYFPDGVKAAVDVRGGAPGTVNATALMNNYDRKMMQAVVFSGGSWYGLSAVTGVANAIKKRKAEEGNTSFIAGVVGAIINDYRWRKMSRVTPDDALGQEAFLAAKPGRFPLGARGAGRFAMQGWFVAKSFETDIGAHWPHSGQGGAFSQIGQTKIAVFTVVNSYGAIVDRNGRVVRCARNELKSDCPLIKDSLRTRIRKLEDHAETKGPTANTTVTLVVTNRKMPIAELQRLAKQVHGSMSRAIQPFATGSDGDVLYAVTTDQVDDAELPPQAMGVIVSELAWDAVLASVPDLPPVPVEANSPSREMDSVVGDYEFNGPARLAIRIEEGKLVARIGGESQMYFSEPVHELIPAEGDLFIIDRPARDVIRFDRADGQVTSLTINPGPWAMKAEKVE
jgi:L-aminopeptidase/D-esterase-like protein